MNKLFFITLFCAFLFATSTLVDAGYITGSGYSNPYTLERGNYYDSYNRGAQQSPLTSYGSYNPGRTRVTDEYFSFPYGRGSAYYTNNRDSALESFFTSQNTDRGNQFNGRVTDSFFGSQATSNRNLFDSTDQASSRNMGGSFDQGSASYSQGNCVNGPSYERTLKGDFYKRRNDFTITETICGGPQVNLQRNFGNANAYDTSASTNRRTLQDNIYAGVAARTNTVDRTTATNDVQQTRNAYSLQQSSFGQGYTLVFS